MRAPTQVTTGAVLRDVARGHDRAGHLGGDMAYMGRELKCTPAEREHEGHNSWTSAPQIAGPL